MERSDPVTAPRWCIPHSDASAGDSIVGEHCWKAAWHADVTSRDLEDCQIVEMASLLAGISELADRYNVQPNTVAVWTQRHQDFPDPLIQVGGRIRVWWVPDVDEWYNQRQR